MLLFDVFNVLVQISILYFNNCLFVLLSAGGERKYIDHNQFDDPFIILN